MAVNMMSGEVARTIDMSSHATTSTSSGKPLPSRTKSSALVLTPTSGQRASPMSYGRSMPLSPMGGQAHLKTKASVCSSVALEDLPIPQTWTMQERILQDPEAAAAASSMVQMAGAALERHWHYRSYRGMLQRQLVDTDRFAYRVATTSVDVMDSCATKMGEVGTAATSVASATGELKRDVEGKRWTSFRNRTSDVVRRAVEASVPFIHNACQTVLVQTIDATCHRQMRQEERRERDEALVDELIDDTLRYLAMKVLVGDVWGQVGDFDEGGGAAVALEGRDDHEEEDHKERGSSKVLRLFPSWPVLDAWRALMMLPRTYSDVCGAMGCLSVIDHAEQNLHARTIHEDYTVWRNECYVWTLGCYEVLFGHRASVTLWPPMPEWGDKAYGPEYWKMRSCGLDDFPMAVNEIPASLEKADKVIKALRSRPDQRQDNFLEMPENIRSYFDSSMCSSLQILQRKNDNKTKRPTHALVDIDVSL